MDFTQLSIVALVAVLIFTAVLFIQQKINKKQQSEDLADRIASGTSYSMDDDSALQSLEHQPSDFAKVLASLLPLTGINVERATKDVKIKLLRAGLDPSDGPIIYLFWQRILSVIFTLIAVGFFMADSGDDDLLFYTIGTILLVVGILGPKLYVKNHMDKRQKELRLAFPDALDLMLICVESGLTMDAALNRVCDEMGETHPGITHELVVTRLELALLNDRTTALLNLGDRTDMVAFRALATALIQTERFGTSLADTLRVMADDFRQTRILDAENRAARIPALMTIPLICFLLPAFMMIILGPIVLSSIERGGFMQ